MPPRDLKRVAVEELIRWGTAKVLGSISAGGIASFVVLYFALLEAAPLMLRIGVAAAFAGVIAVLIVLTLVAIGASSRPMLTVDAYDGSGALYFRVSVAGDPPLSVVKFQLATTGQSVIPTAEVTTRKSDGAKFLQQGGASGATWAQQDLTYLRTPFAFDEARVQSGWIAFRAPENGRAYQLIGHDPHITALLSDGRTLRATYNTDNF